MKAVVALWEEAQLRASLILLEADGARVVVWARCQGGWHASVATRAAPAWAACAAPARAAGTLGGWRLVRDKRHASHRVVVQARRQLYLVGVPHHHAHHVLPPAEHRHPPKVRQHGEEGEAAGDKRDDDNDGKRKAGL